MQIFIRFMDSRVVHLEVDGDTPISSVKHKLETQTQIPFARMRLLYGNPHGGQILELDDERTLDDYNVHRDATIQCTLRPRPRPVDLNVGGRRFTTFLSTLVRARGSWLETTFEGLAQGGGAFAPAPEEAQEEGEPGRAAGELPTDRDGAYIIDRDPECFRYVLYYLRQLPPIGRVAAGAAPAHADEEEVEADAVGAAPLAEPPGLRAELEAMKLSAVKRRAMRVGVDAQALVEADDTDNIKQSVIELIVEVLRRPNIELPTEAAELRLLTSEAEFYRLPELAAACRRQLQEGFNPSQALLREMEARGYSVSEQATLVRRGVKSVEALELLRPSDLRLASVDLEAAEARARRVAVVTAAERAELRGLLAREAGRIRAEVRAAVVGFVGSVERLIDLQLSADSADARALGLDLVETRVLLELLRAEGVCTIDVSSSDNDSI